MSQIAKVKTSDQSIWLSAKDWRIVTEDDYDVKEKKEWNLSAKYNIGKKVEAKDNTENASTEV